MKNVRHATTVSYAEIPLGFLTQFVVFKSAPGLLDTAGSSLVLLSLVFFRLDMHAAEPQAVAVTESR